ncbi:MAG: hypothetical protein RSC76_00370 [Oscillospiraceae bacterium]
MNNNQLENLLKIAAQRLGTTPEALKKAADSGQMGNLVGGGGEGELLQKVLSDPDAAQKLLSTPQARKLMELLGNQK